MHAAAATTAPATNPPPASRGPWSALVVALSDIKIAHSVFAMPFALLAAFLVGHRWDLVGKGGPNEWIVRGRSVRWGEFSLQLVLIVLCMFFARTWAMLVNRVADARFDAANARTAGRAIARGSLSRRSGLAAALFAACGFVACCGGFLLQDNPLPLVLALPVLAWIALYSYTKRFTWLCHVFLGGALAVSPIAAAIAVGPWQLIGFQTYVYESGAAAGADADLGRVVLLLAGFILFWVAGFDVAYALQDIEFDRRAGLHSIPARLGLRGALLVSRAFHAAGFLFLVLALRADPRFGAIMLGGVALVGAILVFEHVVLARRGVAGLPLAFFTLNGIVSCVLGAAGIADILIA